MRYFSTLILGLTLLNNIYCQSDYSLPDVPMFDSFGNIDFFHVTWTLPKDSMYIEKDQIIGEISEYPRQLSNGYDTELQQSMQFYDLGEYKKAISVLETAIKNESDNPFVLNAYARACYKIDRDKSYDTYEKLIKHLDTKYNNSNELTTIDMWFREAYWKYGTLLMDNKKWTEAYYEISRFLVSIQDNKESIIYIEALQYLTECAYVLYDDKTALHLAKRTLFYDPENEYAKDILNKLK